MTQPQWTAEAIRCGPDPACGTEVTQLTSEPVTSHNIYCEQRYASADGRRVAVARKPFGRPAELWVCDLPSLRLARVAEGIALAANSPRNAVYYYAADANGGRLMRLDLADLSVQELFGFKGRAQTGGFVSPDAPKGTVSPNERWFVGGPHQVRDNVYSLRLMEIATGEERTLCEVEDMFNPHLQFDLSGGGRLLVQVNRGGSPPWMNDGRGLAGPDGSTLIVVDVPSGTITPLPVGAPQTGRISGHLCWVAQTGRIVFTGAPGVHPSMASGTGVYEVAPGDAKARQVGTGEPFNHIAASDDGRFFIVDNYRTYEIFVGSIETGHALKLCDSHTRQGKPQHTHVHPYLTPDNRHVIFNSSATGVAQMYAARVPDGFLESVLKPQS